MDDPKADTRWLFRLAAARRLHAEAELRSALAVLEQAGIACTVVARPDLAAVALLETQDLDAQVRVPRPELRRAALLLRQSGWRTEPRFFTRLPFTVGRAIRLVRGGIALELTHEHARQRVIKERDPEPGWAERYRALWDWLRGRGSSFSFMDLDLRVDPGVFKPEPWSAHVVRAVLQQVQDVSAPLIVDVGAGTGALALSVAAQRPDAQVLGIDISAAAVRNARRNARRLRISGARFLQGALLEPVPEEWRDRVHVILANLPWIPGVVCAHAEQTGATWRGPLWSVHGQGGDGMDLQRRLARSAQPLLCRGGALVLEVDHWQSQQLVPELSALGFAAHEVMPRLVVACKNPDERLRDREG